jgi:hypothetical protein
VVHFLFSSLGMPQHLGCSVGKPNRFSRGYHTFWVSRPG